MADFLDYATVLNDFATAVTAANMGFASVLRDAGDREYLINNMPLLDIRTKRVDPHAVTNATYYSDLTMEVEICAHSFISRADAAKIRDDLTNKLQRYVKDNPRFSSLIETTIVGQGVFGTGESKSEGAFVAGAVLEFHPRLYTE